MVRKEEIAEQIRRNAVSRTLKRMELSSEVEEAIERMSHSLVDRILRDLLCPLRLWGRATNNKDEEISFRYQRMPEEETPQRDPPREC